jgi:hypothetical protein
MNGYSRSKMLLETVGLITLMKDLGYAILPPCIERHKRGQRHKLASEVLFNLASLSYK